MKRTLIACVFVIGLWTIVAVAQSGSPVPADEEIRKILVQRIDEAKQSVGVVVGVIEPNGRRIVSYGALAKDDKRPLNGDTIFEIGSVTKVFTSLLLADMVQRGEVGLNDPIAKYLPSGVKAPERGGRSITLVDLSTHTSGLPRLPTNMAPKDSGNPYADYSVERLYQFLSGYTLTRDIGSLYEYSNLGGGLLGHILARRAGMDYEALMRSRISAPLDMSNTRITLSADMKTRLAVGHNGKLVAVPNWDLPTLAGAGALRSNANDLLKFVAAHLGYTMTPLAPAMSAMLAVRRPTPIPGLEIALGWHVFKRGDKEIIWHNGGTGGYRSFVGYDPKARTGVVVLANAETNAGVDDIGLHLLDERAPLIPPNSPAFQPPKEHTEITIDPKVFDRYAGRYQFTPQVLLTFTREDDHFFVQLTGQPKVEIFPETEQDYFLKIVDAQIKFEVDSQGRAAALTMYQAGRVQRANRFDGEPQPIWFGHKEITIDPNLLDRYVGGYQVVPNVVLTITREGAHLFGQLTGQQKIEHFPESERGFFLKVVDAQVTFEVDDQGRTTAAVLHQNGRDQRAPRME